MKIVLFLGFSGSGKTTALSSISRALVKGHRGKVGSIKRIHEENFSIDSKGKDTWQHAASGSSVVVAFARKEIDIISKKDTRSVTLKEILEIFRRSKVDYLLVEGLHKKFENVRGVKRIVCARSQSEAADLIKIHSGKILFVTGKFAKKIHDRKIGSVPILCLPQDNDEALRLVEK